MPENLDVILLAGGLGTRLRRVLPEGTPKALAPVGGRAFLELLVDQLYTQGVRKIIFSLGYGADRIVALFRARSWPADLKLKYAIEPAPLGTGGGLRFAFSETASDPVVGMNGDTFCDVNLARLVTFHRTRGAAITLVVTPCPDTSRYGRVECAPDGKVTRFAEKDASSGPGLINCGVCAISAAVLRDLPEGKSFSWEKDVLARRVGRGLYALEVTTRFLDIGTPESLEAASSLLS